jgi:hypothetical protein
VLRGEKERVKDGKLGGGKSNLKNNLGKKTIWEKMK